MQYVVVEFYSVFISWHVSCVYRTRNTTQQLRRSTDQKWRYVDLNDDNIILDHCVYLGAYCTYYARRYTTFDW